MGVLDAGRGGSQTPERVPKGGEGTQGGGMERGTGWELRPLPYPRRRHVGPFAVDGGAELLEFPAEEEQPNLQHRQCGEGTPQNREGERGWGPSVTPQGATLNP